MSTPQNPQQPAQVPPGAPEGHQIPAIVQPGYAPQGQPIPQPANMQQGGSQPATPAKKPNFFTSNLFKIIVGVLLVVLSTGVIYAWRLLKGENTDGTMKEGSCYTITTKSGESDSFKKIDCSDTSKMNFLVTEEGSGETSSTSCGDDEYAFQYTFTKRGSTTHKYSCLMPNFAEGKCYYESAGTPDLVDCADSKAMIKVTQRIDGKNDVAACGEGAHGFVYDHPARTYCVGNPKK